jgi:DNA helicase-2/ATP-dependent DNA helicase PcrA
MPRTFTDEQLTVVRSPHSRVIVSAAAGSGKTATLRARIRHLLDRGVLASEVLVLSFANGAVDTLKKRIANEGIKIMTFHAFGCEVVRNHAAAQRQRPPDFIGLKATDVLLKMAVDACPNTCDVVKLQTGIRLPSNKERKRLASFFSRIQGSDELAQRVADDPGSGFASYRPVLMELREIRVRYEQVLDRSGGIDYAGMLRRGYDLLRRNAVQLPYRHVLIDEAQDMSAEQARLLAGVAENVPNMMAFGDPHQAIFGFMGASFRHLREALPDAVVLSLSRSFRLTHETAATANAIVNDRKRPIVGDRAGRKPLLFRFRSAAAQERAVIHLVGKLMRQGVSGGSIAILATTKMQLRNMEHALRGEGYETEPMYWTRVPRHVDSFLDLLTFVEKWKWAVTADGRIRNRWTENRLCRILGIDPDTISREVLSHCRRRLVAAARASSLASRYVIVSRIYIKLVAAVFGRDINVARELECWEAISRRFEKVDRLRTHIAALRVQPKIVMSTIHGAKGGEWNHVIVLNVTEGALPLHHAIRTNMVHEEQRLFYVAVTRARERLYLFHAPYRHAWSGEVFAKPSPFLTDSVLATLSGHSRV